MHSVSWRNAVETRAAKRWGVLTFVTGGEKSSANIKRHWTHSNSTFVEISVTQGLWHTGFQDAIY
ncbi:hypothetical protein OUZ56_013896 [Daphnia magna]|uniref:Uncharacterized protein n=1 Tax=Daphnia magna TaxID=35525 RepID=A0ABQ9Z789_9CRUS|nr:hypothetical protein OUZ56_013896 [Daphnia magna]